MDNKHHLHKPSDGENNDENVNDVAGPNINDELTDDRFIDEFETDGIASTVADKLPMDKNFFF